MRSVGHARTLRDVRGCDRAGAIRRLYFGASDPKGGAVLHGRGCSARRRATMRRRFMPGIGEEEAGRLLRRFFQERR
jgi:tRNA(adenine34) deaminase